ncbi:MAG TPA: EF-hand domain-containing protein [Steroidobacteraceae bacterium]|nr:EF-hand domain-containing protein [Steroidobacteraceae bacterium]
MKLALSLMCMVLASMPVGPAVAQARHSELKPIAFATLDSNKDGKLSRIEARADPGLYAAFDMLDLNHDGFLSPEEFQAWPRALKTKGTEIPNPATAPGGSAGAQHMPGPQS